MARLRICARLLFRRINATVSSFAVADDSGGASSAPVATFDKSQRHLKVILTVDVDAMNFDDETDASREHQKRRGPDPGSRPWLLMKALNDGYRASSNEGSHDSTPEEAYSVPGNDGPVRDDDVLPEDRFHKADLVSQHYIQQKMQGREEKQQKYEKEKKPNVKTGRLQKTPSELLYRTETQATQGQSPLKKFIPSWRNLPTL